MTIKMRSLIGWLLLALLPLAAAPAAELPIFDAHIHYSHDTRDVAEKIAWRNGEAVIGPLAAGLKKP